MLSLIGGFASTQLRDGLSTVFKFVKGEEEACTNSGTTHLVLNDYKAFLNFKKVIGRHIILGDDTKVPICGKGMGKFSLNSFPAMVAQVSPL